MERKKESVGWVIGIEEKWTDGGCMIDLIESGED
jgi:hypothetical protein